jgi:hypothetical protein
MQPIRKDVRVAALFYVLMGLPAPFALIYIPRKLIVRGDAAATANNILVHETLFRLGIFGELFCAVAFLLLAMRRVLCWLVVLGIGIDSLQLLVV